MELVFGLGQLMWNMGKSVKSAQQLADKDSEGWNGEYRDVGPTVDLSPIGDTIMQNGFNEWGIAFGILQSAANTAARAIYKKTVKNGIDFLPEELWNI